MARFFRWMTAFNAVGVLILLIAMAVPAVLAFMLFPRYSGELVLVPIERAAAPVAPARVPDEESARLEIPVEFRTPDLVPRPWEELPGGAVRLRD